MTLKQLTPEKTCPVCDNGTFTLCEDFTRYSLVKLSDGKLTATEDHEEEQDEGFDPNGSRRLLCIECAEYLQLPPELEVK